MHHPAARRLASLFALVLGGLVLLAGMAVAQPPGYGEGGPAASLSASASADSITVTGTGFEPGEPVTGTVFSRPMSLGTQNADSTGSVTFTFSVRNLTPGEHRVVLEARSGSVSVTFTVLPSGGENGGPSADIGNGGSGTGGNSGYGTGGNGGYGTGGELAYTGSDLVLPLGVTGLVLVLGGAAAVVGSRRKRERDMSGR